MKKNKIIVGIIGTIINIPISSILASIIHIQLTKIDVPRTLNDFMKIVANEKFLPLFFLMFSLFEVLIFAILVVNKNSFYSEIDKITDKIQTPKSIGQGQHGTSRWQTQREFEKNFKCNAREHIIKNFYNLAVIVLDKNVNDFNEENILEHPNLVINKINKENKRTSKTVVYRYYTTVIYVAVAYILGLTKEINNYKVVRRYFIRKGGK